MKGVLIDVDNWDEREMLDSIDQALVYKVLAKFHPSPLTAEKIALVLQKEGVEIQKEDVGNALYDGALKSYVYRSGKAPDRLWHLRTIEE